MKLPGWFVKVAKPVYKAVQPVPVLGPGVRWLAHQVLSRERPFKGPGGRRRQADVQRLEQQLQQYGLVIQGLDQANRTLHQRLQDMENLVQQVRTGSEQGVQAVAERVEFVRDETLFELRKALKLAPPAGPAGSAVVQPVEPRVMTPGALERRPLRLNLGCGHLPREGYVNVDGRELPGVDLVADATALPVDPGRVDEIFASHLIEHFPQRYLQDVLLPYWHSLLVPGGSIRLILPDAEAMLKAHAAGDMSFEDLSLVTFGKQDYDGDFHFAMFTPDSVKALLEAAGFDAVHCVASGRVNGLCREMELVAQRPEDA